VTAPLLVGILQGRRAMWTTGGIIVGVIAASAIAAFLVASNRWYFAAAMMFALPAAILLHRKPLLGLAVWLLVGPLVASVESGGSGRKVYWVFHRMLPMAIVGVLIISGLVGLRRDKLARLGWPEILMGGYLLATLASIGYTSNTALASTYRLYDRVAVAFAVYLAVRLTRPGARELMSALPIMMFIVVSQAAIGLLQWAAPGVLPGGWLSRVGQRTTGSLSHPNVYGVTVLAAGLVTLHLGLNHPNRSVRAASVAIFGLAGFMGFFTFSRATWLATLAVGLTGLLLYPKPVLKLGLGVLVLALGIGSTGAFGFVVDQASARFMSEQSTESALSRLPVVLASIRMFEAKPLTGWGYENFDRFDLQFQSSVGDLFVPDKDHASHNFYLSLAAEQGLPGIVLYLGPALILAFATPAAYRRLPRYGIVSRRLVVVLWTIPAAQFIVNNFSNLKVAFGFGVWWLSLGLIASLVMPDRHKEPAQADVAAVTASIGR
jgi:O-antigen ligase